MNGIFILRALLVLFVCIGLWFVGRGMHKGYFPPDEAIFSSSIASRILGGIPGRPLRIRGVGFQIMAIFLTLFLFLYILDVISITELEIWVFIILCGVSLFIFIHSMTNRKKKDKIKNN
jgi:hypothetical protein